MKTKILFVCTGNKDRSPTAEALYKNHPALEARSAGTWKYAKTTLTDYLLAWADRVIVMEPGHEEYIREQFPAFAEKTIRCLNIPDDYQAMDSELIRLIEERMRPLL